MADTSNRSFAEERRSAILDMLEHNASLQVTELAQVFGVSSVTIRGDLDALAHDGKLRRTHGGAVSLHRALTVSVQDRRVNVNAEAKQAVARAALNLVNDGDTLLVDSGTTALEFVRLLGAKSDVTVITADISVANYIDESLPAVNVIELGGALRKGHRYLYGPLTMRSLEILAPDKAFVCPGAFVPGRGFMTNFEQMAEVKTAFLASAHDRVVMLDASKVNHSGLIRFAGLSDADAIVMDRDPEGILAGTIAELPEGVTRPRLVLAT